MAGSSSMEPPANLTPAKELPVDQLPPPIPNPTEKDGSEATQVHETPRANVSQISRKHSSLLRSIQRLFMDIESDEFEELTLKGVELRRDRILELWINLNDSHQKELNQVDDEGELELELREFGCCPIQIFWNYGDIG